MPSCLSDILPFSLMRIKNEYNIRNSQEKLIELAQEHLNKKNFQDAIFFYKKVQDSMTLDSERKAISENIDKILELMEEEDYFNQKDKQSQEKKQNESMEGEQNEENPSEGLINISKEGLNIRVDNITFSGIQLESGEKALEVLENIILKKRNQITDQKQIESPKSEEISNEYKSSNEKNDLPSETRQVEEEIFQKVLQERNFKPRKLASNISEEDEKKHQELLEEEAKNTKNTFGQSDNDNDYTDIPLIDPGMEKYYRKSDRKKQLEMESENESVKKGKNGHQQENQTGSSDSPANDNIGSKSDGMNINPKLDMSINNGEPIKVENVGNQKKLQKITPVQLTYNFQNVFYNKFYLKYSDMFNEAARLVRDKKLDEAMEYYKTLLDQRLPDTMRLMVQQNVEDLKNTITNTFKYADTIVEMDQSGKLVRLDDIDTVKVFEERKKGKDDVFFNEEK